MSVEADDRRQPGERERAAAAPMRRALISVSDKSGVVDFAQGLQALGVEIVSTGGTAAALSEGGIAVRTVEELTGAPEILGGRVKTLHPRLHGALLAVRDDPEHAATLERRGDRGRSTSSARTSTRSSGRRPGARRPTPR